MRLRLVEVKRRKEGEERQKWNKNIIIKGVQVDSGNNNICF